MYISIYLVEGYASPLLHCYYIKKENNMTYLIGSGEQSSPKRIIKVYKTLYQKRIIKKYGAAYKRMIELILRLSKFKEGEQNV
jgi:hypothetical protein